MVEALRRFGGAQLTTFFADRDYFRQLYRFALPITLQSLVTNSLNLVGVLLIGQLGEAPVAAVGLANQIFFLLQLILFGISSGAAMFTAQLWGRGDLPNIRRVLALCLMFAFTAAGVFFLIATLAPEKAIGIYSTDPEVIALGSEYLRVYSAAFLAFAMSISFGVVLRSTGDVKVPMLISTGALVLNMALSYVLIFGKLGLPALGVRGAALAALTARLVEAAAILSVVYLRRPHIAVRLSDFRSLDLGFAGRVFRPMFPVILNETFWSFGISAYFVVYGRMGTDSIAAMNIVSTIDNVTLVLAFGIANATAIMVGNRIGAGETERAYRFAGRSLTLAMLFGLIIGSQVLLWSPAVLSLYRVSPQVIENARRVLIIVAFFQWIRGCNATMVVGVLRSGGDARFSFFLDGVIIWMVGVPMAFFGAFVLHLPVYWVYFMVMSEEFLKWILGLRRYFSRRWIHDMAGKVEVGEI